MRHWYTFAAEKESNTKNTGIGVILGRLHCLRSILVLLLFAHAAAAQNSFSVLVKDSATGVLIIGAAVVLQNTTTGATTDLNGVATVTGIADGTQAFTISYIGYIKKSISVTFPLTIAQPLVVLLAANEAQLEEVIVTSTRTNSRIEDAPIKVEVLGEEDLVEENSIKPGNVASVLGDISSVQIQQTSPVSNSSVVRMQGLDGKYTLLLRDGMPAFGGLSGGLNILQIPPLDLKQIEIIKGPASTLNGGGAIAGIINFISKQPLDSGEFTLTLNESTLKETNVNAYLSGRKNKSGYTMLGAYTTQQAGDVDKDGFSDVPQLNSLLLHPQFFYDFSEATKLKLGVTASSENRKGGDMQAVNGSIDSLNSFYLSTKSERAGVDLELTSVAKNSNELSLKSSANRFDRKENSWFTDFSGVQWNVYSELSYLIPRNNHNFVFGGNYLLDDFQNKDGAALPGYSDHTVGLFSQYSLSISKKINLQAGLRGDYHSVYGWFVLPSAAMLIHTSEHFSIRINGGTGYKTPDLLEVEENSFYDNSVLPQFTAGIKPEKSVGGTAEWNYTKIFGKDLSFFFNQTFFLTEIEHSIMTVSDTSFVFINSPTTVSTKGIDNYVRITRHPYELYVGYTYTLPENAAAAEQPYIPYTPLHRAALTLVDEFTEVWRAGVEASYNGFQYRDDGSRTRDYFFLAASVQFKTGHFTFVLNGENLLDFQQSKYEDIVTGTPSHPQFKKLWAPIDGRVINASVMWKI